LKALNEYEQQRKEKFYLAGDLKYENDAFLNQFKKIQSLNPKGILGNSQSKIDATFNDLINKYKGKGYTIPDFSVKNNLFQTDPMLLSQDRLHEFYNYQPKEALDNDSNLKYLDNVNTNVIKIINNNKSQETHEDYRLTMTKESENPSTFKTEVDKNLKYNKSVKSYFNLKKDKKLRGIIMDNMNETKDIFEMNEGNLKRLYKI